MKDNIDEALYKHKLWVDGYTTGEKLGRTKRAHIIYDKDDKRDIVVADDFKSLFINKYTGYLSVYTKDEHYTLDSENFHGIEFVEEEDL